MAKSGADLPEASVQEARQAIRSAVGGSAKYKNFSKLAAAARGYCPAGKRLTDRTLRNAATQLFNEGVLTSTTIDIKRR